MKRMSVHRTVEGKRQSDCCGRMDCGAIEELEVAYTAGVGEGRSYWIDACKACKSAVEGLRGQEGTIRPAAWSRFLRRMGSEAEGES